MSSLEPLFCAQVSSARLAAFSLSCLSSDLPLLREKSVLSRA